MADDAGALLVRSGLVSSSALDDARSRVADQGGTVGEQLVAGGVVSDDQLTDFYKQRLLVPQVNPNTLARLPAKVVAVIPSDMAIELRAIPVSLDPENNLTVAMSDPSDRHAVDEIAFFTGSYVVRAVATQMQIAWCLAHYYGHVTFLGQRLLQTNDAPARPTAGAVRPRTRGMTGKIDAARHRAVAPGSATDVARPAAPEPGPPEPPEAAVDEAVPEIQAQTPRARSISGEIRVPGRRAPSIKPPMPDEESGPVITVELSEEISAPMITIEADAGEDTDQHQAAPPRRKRPAEPDPPELAARAGEVSLKSDKIRQLDAEEPRVVIDRDLEAPPSREVSGEVHVREREDRQPAANITVEVSDEASAPVVIHEQLARESEPVLLERRRDSDAPTTISAPLDPAVLEDDDEVVVLELDTKKPTEKRRERTTQVGIGAAGVARPSRDTEAGGVPSEIDDAPTGSSRTAPIDIDPTRVDMLAAPPGDYTSSDEILAAPPSPMSDDDTSPVAAPPPSKSTTPPPSGQVRLTDVRPRPPSEDDEDDGDVLVPVGRATIVMTAIELDAVIPERAAEVVPAHLAKRDDADSVDDGWGPPGTTIPPPLLGAIPGSGEPASGIIPLPNLDSAPLMTAPPVPPERPSRAGSQGNASPQGLVRTLEEATSRVLQLIGELGATHDRDDVVALMVAHLAESHRRAGFFATRGGELSLFAIEPPLPAMPAATLRLDRPSTLQDIVDTRLPYRGPMHDDASRMFLTSILGSPPPEILLVPVTVRERVVGVLFGEHRLRHTFDDQLALAGRAAGMALERILKAKRG